MTPGGGERVSYEMKTVLVFDSYSHISAQIPIRNQKTKIELFAHEREEAYKPEHSKHSVSQEAWRIAPPSRELE